MCEDITLLDDMQARNTEITQQAEELKSKMIDFQEKIKEDVSRVMERTPLLITHSQKMPTNLDCEDVESYQLPPPIIPQVKLGSLNLSILKPNYCVKHYFKFSNRFTP